MVLRRKVEVRTDRPAPAEGPLAPVGPALAGTSPSAAPTDRMAQDPAASARSARSGSLPARTFADALDPTPGGSLGWLLIALLAAALAILLASLRRLHCLRHS
jgi:hypothetical protein